VFTTAAEAVAAACSIQIALAHERFDLPEPLRVRMAIHTSEADQRDGDYYGSGVNRCARLRGLAHGGQILVSGTTAMVVRDQPLADVVLKSLGSHKLRDLLEPEQVFQVCHPGLPATFPPLDVHGRVVVDEVQDPRMVAATAAPSWTSSWQASPDPHRAQAVRSPSARCGFDVRRTTTV
jgi:hypothetical protein